MNINHKPAEMDFRDQIKDRSADICNPPTFPVLSAAADGNQPPSGLRGDPDVPRTSGADTRDPSSSVSAAETLLKDLTTAHLWNELAEEIEQARSSSRAVRAIRPQAVQSQLRRYDGVLRDLLTDVSALRDRAAVAEPQVTAALILAIAKTSGNRPRVHGNGFIQLDLTSRVRLHVWGDPRIPCQAVPTPIHDHAFGFTSYVLRGALRNVISEVRLATSETYHYQPHGIVSRQLEDTHLAPVGDVVEVVRIEDRIISAGESYSMEPGQIHESIPMGLSVSVIVKHGASFTQGAPSPLVFVPVGKTPDNEFNRYAADPELLWTIVEEALRGDREAGCSPQAVCPTE